MSDQQSDPRSGAVGATAFNPSVSTVSNFTSGRPDVPGTDLCWLELNANQWEVWTSRDGRQLMLFSSGRDQAKALDDLAIYEAHERGLRQT